MMHRPHIGVGAVNQRSSTVGEKTLQGNLRSFIHQTNTLS